MFKLTFALALVGGVAYAAFMLHVPEPPPVAVAPPPPFHRELLGRYWLVVGDKSDGQQAESRWCYLDLSRAENPVRLVAEAWRPDDQDFRCDAMRARGRRIQLTVRRSYSVGEADVSEDWILSGTLDRRDTEKGKDPAWILRGTGQVVTHVEDREAPRRRRYRFSGFRTDISRRDAVNAFMDRADTAEEREAKVKKARAKEAKRIKDLVTRGEG